MTWTESLACALGIAFGLWAGSNMESGPLTYGTAATMGALMYCILRVADWASRSVRDLLTRLWRGIHV
jgi:hypothetical protein